MTYRYLPMTDQDREAMLYTIGVNHVDELFADIPEAIRFKGKLDIPEAMSEPELVRHMRRLADQNLDFGRVVSFLGAGMYEHHIPSVVGHVIGRSEFYTAYTPYQPEISQGELQAIFEFQSMICELTGMEVANSSMYDGPTALAEAASMASAVSRKGKVLVSRTVHPEARSVLRTLAKGLGHEIVEVPHADGVTDVDRLDQLADAETAAIIVQTPNFFGNLEDLSAIEPIAHRHKGLFVVSVNPLSLGILEPPASFGADVVVGDAQPLGIPVQFGGPSCGFFATTDKLMRRIPGRIVGQTTDEDGVRGFVLTLQAREQHIRREKATSNICSNQALNALAAAVYMSAMGKQGMQDVANLNLQKAHYAYRQLLNVSRVEPLFEQPFFNEFAVKLPRSAKELQKVLLEKGILGGYDLSKDYPELGDAVLLAVTEVRTKAEIDELVSTVEGWV